MVKVYITVLYTFDAVRSETVFILRVNLLKRTTLCCERNGLHSELQLVIYKSCRHS